MARHDHHEFGYPRSFHGRYDPNQPRVSRGHPDGGRWTSGGHRALSELAELRPPDMRGDDENRALHTRLALSQEQPPFPGTHTKPPDIPPARFPGPIRPDWRRALGGLIIGKMLRDLFSSSGTAVEPVVPFRARLYRWDGEKYVFETDGLIDEDEAKKYCPELEKIRSMLDEAVGEAGPPGIGKKAGAYGSRVHGLVQNAIKNFNADKQGTPELQLGFPEQSIRKDGTLIMRFEKGTIRPDLNKLRNEEAWCVFEHKVSVAATVDDERMDEIAIRLSKSKFESPHKTPEHLIIIETKPWKPPELRSPANR